MLQAVRVGRVYCLAFDNSWQRCGSRPTTWLRVIGDSRTNSTVLLTQQLPSPVPARPQPRDLESSLSFLYPSMYLTPKAFWTLLDHPSHRAVTSVVCITFLWDCPLALVCLVLAFDIFVYLCLISSEYKLHTKGLCHRLCVFCQHPSVMLGAHKAGDSYSLIGLLVGRVDTKWCTPHPPYMSHST